MVFLDLPALEEAILCFLPEILELGVSPLGSTISIKSLVRLEIVLNFKHRIQMARECNMRNTEVTIMEDTMVQHGTHLSIGV